MRATLILEGSRYARAASGGHPTVCSLLVDQTPWRPPERIHPQYYVPCTCLCYHGGFCPLRRCAPGSQRKGMKPYVISLNMALLKAWFRRNVFGEGGSRLKWCGEAKKSQHLSRVLLTNLALSHFDLEPFVSPSARLLSVSI